MEHSEKVDVYAFGAMVCQIVTGMEVKDAVPKAKPGVTACLDLAMKCCELRPAARPWFDQICSLLASKNGYMLPEANPGEVRAYLAKLGGDIEPPDPD
jgi:hypothetical protein